MKTTFQQSLIKSKQPFLIAHVEYDNRLIERVNLGTTWKEGLRQGPRGISMKWGRRLCTFVRTREIVPSPRLCHGIAVRLSTSVLSEKEASLKLHGSNILSSNEYRRGLVSRGWTGTQRIPFEFHRLAGPAACLFEKCVCPERDGP